jgi:multidrug resistance efflux pump
MTENIDHSNTTLIPDSAAKQRRKKLLIGLGSIVAIGALTTTAYWLLYGSHFVSTQFGRSRFRTRQS